MECWGGALDDVASTPPPLPAPVLPLALPATLAASSKLSDGMAPSTPPGTGCGTDLRVTNGDEFAAEAPARVAAALTAPGRGKLANSAGVPAAVAGSPYSGVKPARRLAPAGDGVGSGSGAGTGYGGGCHSRHAFKSSRPGPREMTGAMVFDLEDPAAAAVAAAALRSSSVSTNVRMDHNSEYTSFTNLEQEWAKQKHTNDRGK